MQRISTHPFVIRYCRLRARRHVPGDIQIRYLKTGQTSEVTADKQAQSRRTVEGILENIAKNGERAVREYSQKFAKCSPERFRLSKAQIRECVDQVPDSVKQDIEFAQTQIRNFALA